MGVNTTIDGNTLTLTATVLSRDGKQSVRGRIVVLVALLLCRLQVH
jgi:hypothetical protein